MFNTTPTPPPSHPSPQQEEVHTMFPLSFFIASMKLSLRKKVSECGKMRTRITPNTDTFQAVCKMG